MDLRGTDDGHRRQSLESHSSSDADRQQARNSGGTSRDLHNVKGALFPDHDNGPPSATAAAAASSSSSSSSGARRGSGSGTLSLSTKLSKSTIPDRPQITVLPGFPPPPSGGAGSSSKSLQKLDNDVFWKAGKQPLSITYSRKTGNSHRSYIGKQLSSIVGGNNLHNYYNRGMANRVAGAVGSFSMAPSRDMYNNNNKNSNNKAEELAEREARNVARAIAGHDPRPSSSSHCPPPS